MMDYKQELLDSIQSLINVARTNNIKTLNEYEEWYKQVENDKIKSPKLLIWLENLADFYAHKEHYKAAYLQSLVDISIF